MKMLQFGLLIIPPLVYAKSLLFRRDEKDEKEKGLFGDAPSLDGSDVSLESPTRPRYCLTLHDDISIEESVFDEASQIELCGLLGPAVPNDEQLVDPERVLALPGNLHDSVIIDLPVGYYRTRRAFLNSSSNFWTEAILKNALGYDSVNCSGWNHHNEIIGLPNLPDDVAAKDLIGASKTTSYVMPAGKLVGSSVATETATILDYTEEFFVIQMQTSTPGVPFGKTFTAKTQIIVVNLGGNHCQMICSVEPEFPNGAPLGMKGQITRGMKTGTMEMFEKIGSHIKNCALSYGWC